MTRFAVAAAVAAASLSLATFAQYGPGPGPRGGGPRFNDQTTPGWSMMTKQERAEHQARMRAMKDYGECRAYMDEHHKLMEQRAKEKGRKLRGTSPGPGCDWLKR